MKIKKESRKRGVETKTLIDRQPHTCNSVTPTLPKHLSSALLSSSSQYLWRNTCICTSAIHKDHPSQFLTKELFQAGREDTTWGKEFTQRTCCPNDGHRLSLHDIKLLLALIEVHHHHQCRSIASVLINAPAYIVSPHWVIVYHHCWVIGWRKSPIWVPKHWARSQVKGLNWKDLWFLTTNCNSCQYLQSCMLP